MILYYRSYIIFQMLLKRLFVRASGLQFLCEDLSRNSSRRSAKRISASRLTGS